MASDQRVSMSFFWLVLLGLCICSSTRSNGRTGNARRSAKNAYHECPVISEKQETIPSIVTVQTPTCALSQATVVANSATPLTTVPRNYNFIESEIEAVQALSLLCESSKASKANYFPPPRQLSQSNYRTRTPPSVEIAQPRARPQSKTKAIPHRASLVYGKSAGTNIPHHEAIIFPSPVQPDTLHEANSKKSAKRSLWFSTNSRAKLQSFSQTVERDENCPVSFFSQYHCHGNLSHRTHGNYMSGRNVHMGYRVTQDRLLLLDGYKLNASQVQNFPKLEWLTQPLNKAALSIKEFSQSFPLETDGLVVAFNDVHQLLIASYGKPPLGAIILRPNEDYLNFVARSSDDTVEAVDVEDGDIVIVGALGKIALLESGRLQLDSKDSIEEIAQKVYGSNMKKSLCIVAAIKVEEWLE